MILDSSLSSVSDLMNECDDIAFSQDTTTNFSTNNLKSEAIGADSNLHLHPVFNSQKPHSEN